MLLHGIDYRSLSNSLNYGIIPSPRILIRIANYFNVSIKYLLGTTDDEYFNQATAQSDFKTRFELNTMFDLRLYFFASLWSTSVLKLKKQEV